MVPLTFGKFKIYIKVVICDVTIPLISTNDLISQGVSVLLNQNEPYIEINKTKYKLLYQNKHFWMKQKYNDEGIFGVTTKKQPESLVKSTNPVNENFTNFQPKTQKEINRDFFYKKHDE